MVALATPTDAHGELDDAGLQKLIDHVLAGGVSGVCPVGSTGEGPRFTVEQRLVITARVRSLVPASVAVVPALGVTSIACAHSELMRLAELMVTAALVAPPSYYPLAADEAFDFYAGLADAAEVPLVLYNIPSFTKVSIPLDAVSRLASHPRIVGIKDSSRDMEYLSEVLVATHGAPDFGVYTGTDTLLTASLAIGADGTIAASANVVPQLSVGICTAMEEMDRHRALELQRELTKIVLACRRGASPSGWKAAIHALGICGADCVPPANPLADPLRAELVRDLRDLGVLDRHAR
jgi:4-hydroxy-tetrahydrodipicolinate synthase